MCQSHKNSYKIKVTQKNGQNNECRDEREKERNEMQSESFILIVHAFWASGGKLDLFLIVVTSWINASTLILFSLLEAPIVMLVSPMSIS